MERRADLNREGNSKDIVHNEQQRANQVAKVLLILNMLQHLRGLWPV